MPQLKRSPRLVELANQVRAGADLDWIAHIEGLDSAEKSRIRDLLAPARVKQKGAYTPQEQAKLVALHEQGLDAAQIAQELGRTDKSVLKALRTQELVARPCKGGIGAQRASWCMEQLRARRRAQGLSVEQLAGVANWPPKVWQRRETACVDVVQADLQVMGAALGVELVLVEADVPSLDSALSLHISPLELARHLTARRVACGASQQAQGALEGIGKSVIANRERCRQQERGQKLSVLLAWAGHLGLVPALRLGAQLVVWTPSSAVCVQPSQALCLVLLPCVGELVGEPRLGEERAPHEDEESETREEEEPVAELDLAKEFLLYAELMRQTPDEPKKAVGSVSRKHNSRLGSKRVTTPKTKAMRRVMRRNVNQMSEQLLDDLWDTASRYAACGHPRRALRLVRIATGQVRGQSFRRLVGYHRELDRERWEARQAVLRADLAAVAHRGAPSAEEVLCSAAVFFAGVDLAEYPLVEVCQRLARLYAEQAPLVLRQADPGLGEALVRRARLNLGLEVEYTDRDAQHVKRVLERIEGFERPDWSPLDHTIFVRLKQLRGSCRI